MKMTKNSWPVETPQIDTLEGSDKVISSMINHYLPLKFLGQK